MMFQDIVSAFNRAHFHKEAMADFRIMNARSNPKGLNMAVTHQPATAEVTLPHCGPIIIITVVRTVDKGVIDVEENATQVRVKINTVPLVRYIETGTDGWQKL
jgi:hypothetical protein